PLSRRRVAWWVDASVERATGRSPWRRAVEAVLADNVPDLVHAHFGPTACELADITDAAGMPLVTSLYGVDAAVLPYMRQWRDAYRRLFLSRSPFPPPGAGKRKQEVQARPPPHSHARP